MYLEPGTNRIVPFTEQTLAGYIKLARVPDNGIIVRLETMPVGKGRPTQPLEGRVFAWKHGAREGGGIQMTSTHGETHARRTLAAGIWSREEYQV